MKYAQEVQLESIMTIITSMLNSFESVNLGDETFKRSVGIQANISDAKNMVKNSSDFDDEE